MDNQTLRIRIMSPQQLILDTEALSVSSKNIQGNFDVLPAHANFITVLEDAPIVIRPGGRLGLSRKKPLTFQFPIAIMLVVSNVVNIYTYTQP